MWCRKNGQKIYKLIQDPIGKRNPTDKALKSCLDTRSESEPTLKRIVGLRLVWRHFIVYTHSPNTGRNSSGRQIIIKNCKIFQAPEATEPLRLGLDQRIVILCHLQQCKNYRFWIISDVIYGCKNYLILDHNVGNRNFLRHHCIPRRLLLSERYQQHLIFFSNYEVCLGPCSAPWVVSIGHFCSEVRPGGL